MTQQEFSERYEYDSNRDLLGEGGFGRVYRAYDNYEHEYVALKMQNVDPKHPELRLRNEVEKVQQYVHRYIARYKGCYTFSTFGGDVDIAVMKYYKDGGLDQLLSSGKLCLNERYTMLRQILEGIAFLHSHGIIHRDLKPQNVLVVEHDGNYSPLITDFGISKQLDTGESSAVSNSVLGGTYSYASPEQLKETTIRKNTDLWSFGIIAYQMLTDSLPFNCGSFSPTSQEGRLEQFRQMTSGVLPATLNSVPEPWQRLIRQCLVVDNTQRITNAEDAISIIENKNFEQSTIIEDVSIKTDIQQTIVEVQPTLDIEYKRYDIGDYYNENGLEGVVFDVWDNGRHGKIVSLDKAEAVWDSRVIVTKNWLGKYVYKNGTRAYTDSKSDGKGNTDRIMARSDSQYFDAFKWCRAKGSSWYLPAEDELRQILKNRDKLNSSLSELFERNNSICVYWSSTECSEDSALAIDGSFLVLFNGFFGLDDEIFVPHAIHKSFSCYVRAVATF